MKLKHIYRTAWRGLSTHLTRSALTILGIVIGVAAIIVVMSLGQGAQALILNQISGIGPEMVTLRPGGDSFGVDALFSRSLTVDDLNALERPANVPNLVKALPQVMVQETVEYEGERYRPMIIGGNAAFYAEVFDVALSEGDFFNDSDERTAARVAVIGHELAEELFGQSPALGRSIRIQNKLFKVAGVFKEKGTVFGINMDRLTIIPWTAAQVLTGENHFTEIWLQADSTENVEKMIYDIKSTLRDTHDLEPDENDDFNIETQESIIKQIESIITIMTAFLGAIVAISLVVGGIGIMNIMLVSVTERTKEIGLRKALGARKKDILRQFLVEAIILTSIGGIVGVIFGAIIAYGASVLLAVVVDPHWTFVFPIGAAFLGVGVAAAVGLVFGIYPAAEASKKSPIEALRYE